MHVTDQIEDPSVLKKLRAIHNLLIDTGATDGEKQAAQGMLTKLLALHNLRLEDILETKKHRYKFEFDSPYERNLLFSVFYHVLRTDTVGYWNKDWREGYSRPAKRYVWIETTPLQYAEIDSLYHYYKREMNQGLDEYVIAFVLRNKLTNPDSTRKGRSEDEMTPEELERLHRLSELYHSMDAVPRPRKSLPAEVKR